MLYCPYCRDEFTDKSEFRLHRHECGQILLDHISGVKRTSTRDVVTTTLDQVAPQQQQKDTTVPLVATSAGKTIAEMRASDGYVNATNMCKSGGKLWADYFRLDSTKQYLSLLAGHVGYPMCELVKSAKGGKDKGTWVHHKVALHLAYWISPEFQIAVMDLVTRYLTGQVTTEESQSAAQELGVVTKAATCLLLQSYMDNPIDIRKMQIYMRQVFGVFLNLHPVGRPDLMISPEAQALYAIVKFGYQGENTGRQLVHNTSFPDSKIIDSCFTSSYTCAEQRLKDILLNDRELYEGQHIHKSVKDTELLVFKSQAEYIQFMVKVNKVIADLESPVQLKIEYEKTKQAEAQTKQAEAQVRLAELQLEMARLNCKNSCFNELVI